MKKVVYTYSDLGKCIKNLLDNASIGVAEICEECDISKRTYYDVIRGKM